MINEVLYWERLLYLEYVQGSCTSGGAVSLTAAARKRFILAFERRMDRSRHIRFFDYRISCRRELMAARPPPPCWRFRLDRVAVVV
jgi:hypothetical protein